MNSSWQKEPEVTIRSPTILKAPDKGVSMCIGTWQIPQSGIEKNDTSRWSLVDPNDDTYTETRNPNLARPIETRNPKLTSGRAHNDIGAGCRSPIKLLFMS
ncbi:hypothetical protein SCA6_008702 [Theobroma cacao]